MKYKMRLLRLMLLVLGYSASLLAASKAMCQIQDAVVVRQSVWALCGRERLYVTNDTSKSWEAIELPPEILYRGLIFVDDRRALIIGNNGTLLASEDGGKTWAPRQVPTTEHLIDIAFIGESGWIVGRNGLILHTSDGGKTWVQQKTGIPQGLASVQFLDAQNGWAVGWMGVVLRTRNGGGTWETVKIGDASWSLTAVYFRDANNGYIVGMLGQMLRTKDGGETWTLQKLPTDGLLADVYYDKAGTGYSVVGNDVLLTKDGGETWELQGVNQWLFLKRILPVGNTLWAVGTFHILQWDSAKKTWVRLTNVPSSQT